MTTYNGKLTKGICRHGYALFWLKYLEHDPNATLYITTTHESLRTDRRITYKFNDNRNCNCPDDIVKKTDKEIEKVNQPSIIGKSMNVSCCSTVD